MRKNKEIPIKNINVVEIMKMNCFLLWNHSLEFLILTTYSIKVSDERWVKLFDKLFDTMKGKNKPKEKYTYNEKKS